MAAIGPIRWLQTRAIHYHRELGVCRHIAMETNDQIRFEIRVQRIAIVDTETLEICLNKHCMHVHVNIHLVQCNLKTGCYAVI